MTRGIDVSRWQKGFKLENAIKEGFTAVIIKAGGADSGRYKDSQFDNFYNQAVSNGMSLGAYYYGNAFSVNDARAEANHFISLLQGKNISTVFYDVEGKMLNQGKTHLTDIIKTFCDTLKASGYDCGVYSSLSPFNTQVNDAELKAYPHWVAYYSKTEPKLKSGNAIAIWQYGGEINYIRSNKIAGTVVDQDYVYISLMQVNVVANESEIANKSIEELAKEVLEGKYGNGNDRKENLGSKYNEVQAEVERILKAKSEQKYEKSIDQLANEVLAGLYGNGITRRIKLGKNYDAVQKRVEEIIVERKKKGKTYVIQKGDTLGNIAKKYKTTEDRLAKANNIRNKNLIYPGQVLIIN